MARANPEKSPKQLRALKHETEALALRMAGSSYQAIGDILGIIKAAAFKALSRSLARTKKACTEDAEQLKALELGAIDDMIWTYTPLARGDETAHRPAARPDAQAAIVVLRYRERKHKLLGLEAPGKHEVTGKDRGPIDYRTRTGTGGLASKLARLAARVSPPNVPEQPDGGRAA